ncbi:SUKH-4 family immunity protein [Nonomuraea sp. NPDC050153]|uniref:SUKH-4 family immunity protein n=1 Tax=Nonomuraea sp. NPDC050153 TaxID=3364359 RepID=UPI0037AA4B1B
MPTYEDLAAWAGAERVSRADPDVMAGWRIPEEHKWPLVNIGVPVVDRLIEYVDFQTDPDPELLTTSGHRLYRLTRNHHGDTVAGLQWAFGAEPLTGRVHYVLPGGEAWVANSTIDLWLRTLHHYGLHVSRSPILNDADENEDEALVELAELAQELKEIDPPAFEGHLGFIWPEFLDRWLW